MRFALDPTTAPPLRGADVSAIARSVGMKDGPARMHPEGEATILHGNNAFPRPNHEGIEAEQA